LFIFLVTLILGWLSGAFKALRRGSSIKIEILRRPAVCSTFDVDGRVEGQNPHRTAIALYLKINNTGFRPIAIDKIKVGYKAKCIKNPFKWLWLDYLTVCKSDFVEDIGADHKKVLPFLMQQNQLIVNENKTYLRESESTLGIVYFEGDEAWGDCYPKSDEEYKVKIKIVVTDTLNKSYFTKGHVYKVTLAGAKEICEQFGETRNGIDKVKGPA